MGSISAVLIFLSLAVTTVISLEPLSKYSEGSCTELPSVKQIDFDPKFADSLNYISGGSKQGLYWLASHLPNYASMREDEFYYDACYSRNVSVTTNNNLAGVYGFGRTLLTTTLKSIPGTYLQGFFDPADPETEFTFKVTLTDGKTFAVLANCIEGERSWGLITLDPYISPENRKLVEEHVQQTLGFKKKNFVFLRYDICSLGLGNPFLATTKEYRRKMENLTN